MVDSIDQKKMTDSRVKRLGFAGLMFGLASIFACALPVILTLLGMSGLGAVAMASESSLLIGLLGGTLVFLAFLTLWGLIVRRRRKTLS
ncbi:MAG: hypothetical protein ACRBHB_06205 [Arenicella sp.]